MGRENAKDPQVFHDCDAVPSEQDWRNVGMISGGPFVEHRCICIPAHLSPEELEIKERKFHVENPEW